jgi:transcriptional regulator with PAS, ATPase and Fis domain
MADAARAFARDGAPLPAPADLAEARALIDALARSCGERILDLEKKGSRAQENLLDLRVMLDGVSRVKRELRQENEQLRSAVDPGRQPVIGAEGGLREVMRLVDKVLDTPIAVLITGETGTGKEVIARYIHAKSARARGPFVAINCAALPESLLESELFGIEKSVATGVAQRAGKLEEASGGVVFLDEVGDMPPAMQAKILRALQEQEVVRVGGARPIKIDARVVSATNKDLRARIADGRFREDLFYRLVGIHVHLPPLRERPGDLDALIDHFVAETARRFNRRIRAVEPQAREALHRYGWPGNVRELIAEVQRAVAIADGETVARADLTPRVGAELRDPGAPGGPAPAAEESALESLREARRRFERSYVERALARAHGSKADAAKLLGLTAEGLRHKLRTLEMGGARGGPDDEDG